MRWDVTQHPVNSVLMGFSSGDGYFQNSPLMFQPVWKKYRPDRFLDSSSGLQGLQFYRLHGKEIPNYRLRCLQQLKREPQWPTWGWNQISCPCSWQQGRWDLRFQPRGWWGLQGRQLCSFSSWRGACAAAMGPGESFCKAGECRARGSLIKKLELQNWCCSWNDKPSFCALYQKLRPRVTCAGYRPLRPAWMFGDPHITTFDGSNFTFNGLGDFLLVQAQGRNSSFLLQGRTAQTGSAQATNFIAFAAQYNSSNLEDSITVRWLLEPNDKILVLLNNQTVRFKTNQEDAEGLEIFNSTGITMTHNGSLVSASFDGTTTISVMALSNILYASCSLPEDYQNHTEGLLGVWNKDPEDDFKMPDGSIIPRKSSEEMLFHYGMTWTINGTSLLGKRDDHLPANFTPVFFSQLWANTSLNKSLVSGCKEDRACMYDTLATGSRSTGLHTAMLLRSYQLMNLTINQSPPSIDGPHEVEAYWGQPKLVQYTSSSEDHTFILRNDCADFQLFENGTLLWTPNLLKPCTPEILVRNLKNDWASMLQPKMVVCTCKAASQCLYNQTSRIGNSSLEEADCKCDGNTFGPNCQHTKDLCEEPCFPNVTCTPGEGCEACPLNMTGDGRHCTVLESPFDCHNKSCPENFCYNEGYCYISQALNCQPTCTCLPAFTDAHCFLAGNNFTPSIVEELPLRVIRLFLIEEENATKEEVNASVAYTLGNLDVRAFLRNSEVEKTTRMGSFQHWAVTSEFQYRPRGPVIHFLNHQLLEAVVEAFLLQDRWKRWKRSEEPRNNVIFYPISTRQVFSLEAWNVSFLETRLSCNGYKGYHLLYSPQDGFTCVSPCSQGYCEHGGRCQHLIEGPECSCVPFSIYTPWGERCERLSIKHGAFFGILFGALGTVLLLGTVVFVVLHYWGCPRTRYSYPLDMAS